MKSLMSWPNSKIGSSRHSLGKASPGIIDNECGIYDQEYFLKMLYCERKRAERSKETLLVLLLDIRKVFSSDKGGQMLKALAYGLTLSTREIDICGWFSRNAVLGVIFTEISHDNVAKTIDTIDCKLQNTFSSVLTKDVASRIEAKFHIFPETTAGNKQCEPPDLLFYPEINGDVTNKVPGLLKRIIDIVGSITALILFSPLFVVIPVLIKCTSRGPVLYKQERSGLYGKTFVFLKFRSMHVNNSDTIHREYIKKFITDQVKQETGHNETTARVFKIRDDPRITPLGKFLRKTSLDELPQFFNVLKGEMSLVGPRPPIPYELENYDTWHRYRLLGTKPGITGLWQVKGRSMTTFDGMVRLDIEYIRTWSLWLDFKLILQTPLAVLRGKGAY